MILENSVGFCAASQEIWNFVGKIVLVLKILIPVIIIILGIVDLGKAVIASKEDDIKKATNILLQRIIIGIVIFFVPAIVNAVFSLLDNYTKDAEKDARICINCITKSGCTEEQVKVWQKEIAKKNK